MLDPKLRSFVNYEVFFFATDSTKAAFDRDPTPWCGLLTDPVSQKRFRPQPGAAALDYMMRPYYFESAETRAQFESTPDSFAVRRGM